MTLKLLVNESEIDIAVDLLFRTLRQDATEHYETSIGFRGGNKKGVFWRPIEEFWFSYVLLENRHWFAFGLENPADEFSGEIAVEINPPRFGVSSSIAGMFARNENEEIFLAHSGRIGGGRKGIGKSAFIDYLGGKVIPIHTPLGKRVTAVFAEPVLADSFCSSLKRFAESVADFKRSVSPRK